MSENGTTWSIKGDEVASCNCDWACPCQFNGLPNHGFCQAAGAWQVREGHFGDVSLDGVRMGAIFAFPGAIHEGNGTLLPVVDEDTSDEQREALGQILGGEHGGAFFEIFAAVAPNRLDPVVGKIEMNVDRDARRGTLRLADLFESTIEPIKNPVDESEHRVRIDLPEGFEYKQAEIGNTISAEATAEEPLSFKLENTYAQMNEFDWSNA